MSSKGYLEDERDVVGKVLVMLHGSINVFLSLPEKLLRAKMKRESTTMASLSLSRNISTSQRDQLFLSVKIIR